MAVAYDESTEKLADMFAKIWSAYEEIENTSESMNSQKVQTIVQNAIATSQTAIHRVNDLSLFSTNEAIDEVSTKQLRYLLLPALLGYFMNKTTNIDRFDAVKKSQMYFIDFMRLCKLYGLTDCHIPQPFTADDTDQQLPSAAPISGPMDLTEQGRLRQAAIERFRQQKALEHKLEELSIQTKHENADEELTRSYYLTLINKWLLDASENLNSIRAELPLLQHMARLQTSNQQQNRATDSQHSNHATDQSTRVVCDQSKQSMRPFIITKDAMQKAVFGVGYPGIPTVTVDEFYAQRVKDGIFPSEEASHHHGVAARATSEEQEEAEERAREMERARKEQQEDDDTEVAKARNWDDWKDDHRRGWGNTQNKG